MKSFYVYRIEFNDGTFYIGYRGSKKEPEQDLLIHYRTSSKKVKLLIESGVLCAYTILAKGLCKEDAYNMEQEFIYNEFNDKMCLNDACYYGRQGFGIISEEAKQRISKSSKQYWQDSDYRNKVIESQKATWTDERRRQQSERLTGVKRPEHSEKMRGKKLDESHSFFNETKSEEHKQNISKALSGKTKSEEHKQNIKESIHTRTEEDWKRILETRRSKAKPKFEIDGVSFVSLNQASQKLGITPFFVKKLITHRF